MAEFVNIHTHCPSGVGIEIVNCRLGVDQIPSSGLFSVGIHPWDVGHPSPSVDDLCKVLELADCVAIGEVGLDKKCTSDWAMQEAVFSAMLHFGGRPFIIHCVKAQREVLTMLGTDDVCVFHGFIGSPQQASQLWQLGHCTSFGFGALRSPKTMEALKACPSNQLFLETDVDTRGIIALYEEVAKLRDVTVEELKEEIYNNYKRIFDK